MKLLTILAMSGVIALIALAIYFIFCYVPDMITTGNDMAPMNNSTIHAQKPIFSIENKNLTIPSEIQVIESVNWSKYPVIRYKSISKATIEEPNFIINHSFLDLHIAVDVLNPDDVPEIYKEMSSIVKAERLIVGENSSVELFGYIEDGRIFDVGMLPYSNVIFRRDYVHPIHDLTFSDIDASEVD